MANVFWLNAKLGRFTKIGRGKAWGDLLSTQRSWEIYLNTNYDNDLKTYVKTYLGGW